MTLNAAGQVLSLTVVNIPDRVLCCHKLLLVLCIVNKLLLYRSIGVFYTLWKSDDCRAYSSLAFCIHVVFLVKLFFTSIVFVHMT